MVQSTVVLVSPIVAPKVVALACYLFWQGPFCGFPMISVLDNGGTRHDCEEGDVGSTLGVLNCPEAVPFGQENCSN